ncbi:MAG: endonuclease, partial [Bacteroidales bacterium]|nr:endonuclease [Bacteroidales bacterium]
MKNLFFVSLIFIIIISSCKSPESEFSGVENLKLVFYNVENLFDTINDPNKKDESYLPTSKIAWNTERYLHKLDNLAKVISNIDSLNMPQIIGLSEVENRKVLEDLVSHTKLKNADYQIIHKESPDERGIDVALLYQSNSFKPIFIEAINITFPFDESDHTRDILYVKGLISQSDTLHVFVNHWSSRWGGQEKSEPKRIFIAKILKEKVDKIYSTNPKANIVILGDLNDNPDNISILQHLGADSVFNNEEKSLINLSFKRYSNGEGTVYWKSWGFFDQIIVSSNLLDKNYSWEI